METNTNPSADDFIHLSFERSGTSSFTDSFNKSQYSQVVFHDLSEVYPTDGNVSFTYSFQSGVSPQVGDRIALYKVGWTSVSEFVTSLYATPTEDQNSFQPIKITFLVENLPKDEINMYQFCYITSGNIVAGSSIPFTFRKPQGNELVAVEDPNDSGLVVFRSRVTQLQEQLLKSNSDKESLNKSLNELKSELYLVKAELNEQQMKHEAHKESAQGMTNLIYDLNTEKKALMEKLEASKSIKEKELDDLRKLNESLELEINNLKEQLDLMVMEISNKEAAIKTLKETQERLEESTTVLHKALSSSEETSKNTLEDVHNQLDQANFTISRFRTNMDDMEKSFESKLQHFKTTFMEEKKNYEDRISLLKNELTECQNNFDQITHAMVKKEKESNERCDNLSKKIKLLTERNNTLGAENVTLINDLTKSATQLTSMGELLKSKDDLLKNVFEHSDGDEVKRKLILIDDENTVLLVKVSSLEERLHSCDDANAKLSEHNTSLKEEKNIMAEQLSRMNEELRNLKHILSQYEARSSTQPGYQSSSSQTQSNSTKENNDKSPFSFQFPFFGPFQSGGASINVTTKCSSKTPTPEHQCDKCVDVESKVKNLLREKADIRSELIQTKHSNDEYIKLLKGASEEAAALKSRIAVLEIELRKAKEASITKMGEQKYKELVDTLPWKKSGESSLESSSEFKSLEQEHAEKLNLVKLLEQQLQKEIETKTLLQRNVESFMLNDARNYAAINTLKKDNAKLISELADLKKQQAVAEEVIKAIDDMEMSKTELAKKLEVVSSEKLKLEKQLIELRKESVGKVSLTTVQELRNENEALKKQLIEKGNQQSSNACPVQFAESSMEGWSIPHSNFSPSYGITCKVCGTVFPPNSEELFSKHLSDHLD